MTQTTATTPRTTSTFLTTGRYGWSAQPPR
jgi:hypothetical protein